jgi:hypothetical protein
MKHASVVLILAALLCLPACMSFVGGPLGISPSQFQFRPIVPLSAPGPGGWKSARVIIQLIHVTEQGIRKNVICPIEVQVPEVNYLGVVTDEFAQWEAAKAADIAAERALQQQSLLSAELCQRFMQEMLKVMGEAIDGTRIKKAL